MYPLNTDGIDYRATNVTVKNCNITNYDDAIVAKPCNQGGKYCTCSGDAEVYNNTITHDNLYLYNLYLSYLSTPIPTYPYLPLGV